MAEGTLLSILDFGARPDSGEDAAMAIQAALTAAKETPGAKKLVFPKGTYDIYADHACRRTYHTSNTDSIRHPVKTIGVLIEEQENLTVEGDDALLLFHGAMMAVAVIHSRQITLRGFSWDFAVPTVSEMTVAAMGRDEQGDYTHFTIPTCFPFSIIDDGKSIEWRGDSSPESGRPYWTEKNQHRAWSVVAFDPAVQVSRRYSLAEGPLHGVKRIERIDEESVRIIYKKRPASQRVGMTYELCSSRVRETAGAFIWESEAVFCENLGVHFLHGFGWLTQMSRDVSFCRCRFWPRVGSGKLTTSYADLIHVSGAAGTIRIEGCRFGHAHDDPINIHGTFTRVARRLDARTLRLTYVHRQQGGFPQYHVGDEVVFYQRDTLAPLGDEGETWRVEAVENPGEGGNGLRAMTVRFDRDLPAGIAARLGPSGQFQHRVVAENVTYTPAVVIRGNTFEATPTRGILCTTRHPVLIEGNTFTNMAMASIYLSNDSAEWYESGPIRDMTIRGNTFYIRPTGQTEWHDAPAVYIHPVTKGGKLPDASRPVHRNIRIEENTFVLAHDRAVLAESVGGLLIRGNVIRREEPSANLPGVFRFVGCSGVVTQANEYGDGVPRRAETVDTAADALDIQDGLEQIPG